MDVDSIIEKYSTVEQKREVKNVTLATQPQKPKYVCPKHGEVTAYHVWVDALPPPGAVPEEQRERIRQQAQQQGLRLDGETRSYCFMCYLEFLDKHVRQCVREEPG